MNLASLLFIMIEGKEGEIFLNLASLLSINNTFLNFINTFDNSLILYNLLTKRINIHNPIKRFSPIVCRQNDLISRLRPISVFIRPRIIIVGDSFTNFRSS